MYLIRVLVILYLIDHSNSWTTHRRSDNLPDSSGCSFLTCKKNERCVNRKFWCKNQPCPSMIYCSKSPEESLKGPPTCETVKCSRGYICVVKHHHCKWNEPCQDETARCISDHEYYDGPATCGGYKCPSGQTCILRESICSRPPCKLLKSCSNVFMWKSRCQYLGCLSEHECFLRRPQENCPLPFCKHQPDCTAKNENELIKNEKCYGWICPRDQQCVTKTIGPCHNNNNCRILRSCVDEINIDSSNFNNRPFTKSLMHTQNIPQWSSSSLNPPDVESASSPLTSWLNYLRAHTGAETVKIWIENAEKKRDIVGFRLWLESVKDMLGIQAFNLWLDEVQVMTMNNKPFQDWLLTTLANLNYTNNNNKFTTNLNNPVNNIKKDDDKNYHETQSIDVSKNSELLFSSNGNLYEGRRVGSFLPENQPEIMEKQRQSFINFLTKLSEERQLYMNVINQTHELFSKARPLLPVNHIDYIIKNLKNHSNSQILFDVGLSRRTSYTPTKEINSSNIVNVEVTDDYSDDENEFVLVDYDDPAEYNKSTPRIYIKVEKKMDHPIKIGDVQLNFEDNYTIEELKNSPEFKRAREHLFDDFNNE